MTNPETTKLRLIHERLKRVMDEREQAAREARNEWEPAWRTYVDSARADGYCPICEGPVSECRGCQAAFAAQPSGGCIHCGDEHE